MNESSDQTDGTRGWVYVITNRSLPNLLKVGYSGKDPILRAEELNHTGVPQPYVVEYDVLVISPYRLEQRVHKALESKRERKEWFRCSVEEAIAAINTIAAAPEFQVKARQPRRSDPLAPASPQPGDFGGSSARWTFSARSGQLTHKSSGRMLGREDYRYDGAGAMKGFTTQAKDVLWIAVEDVELVL